MDINTDPFQNYVIFGREVPIPQVKTDDTKQQYINCLYQFKEFTHIQGAEWSYWKEWNDAFFRFESLTLNNLELIIKFFKRFYNSKETDPLVYAFNSYALGFLRILWTCHFPFGPKFHRMCKQLIACDRVKNYISQESGYQIEINGKQIKFRDANELVSFYLGNPKILDRSGFLRGLVRDHQSNAEKAVGIAAIFIPFLTPPNETIEKTNGKLTALHCACIVGHVDMVKMVLEHGKDIDVNPRDTDGNTPLQYASFFGHDEIVQMFKKTTKTS